jgi:hypothetical protein
MTLTGITNEQVDVCSQAQGYTDRPIFLAWFTDLFLPDDVRRREATGYQRHAVLNVDDCTANTGPEVAEACTAPGGMVCPLPLHSSNQPQQLDLSTFGIAKRQITRINRMETMDVQYSRTAPVVSSFISVASPLDVVGAFLSVGIALTLVEDRKLCCCICQERARCVMIPIVAAAEQARTEDEAETLERALFGALRGDRGARDANWNRVNTISAGRLKNESGKDFLREA